MSAKVIEAMRALGIGDTENIDRVIIDLKIDHIPVIHVRHHGGGTLLDLVDALTDGPRIEWVEDGRQVTPEHMTQRRTGGPRAGLDPPPVDVKADPWLRAPAPGSPA